MNKKLGKSQVNVTPLSLGSFAMGGLMWAGNNKQDSIGAIQASIENGITTIDTAPFYGLGLSEEFIGDVLKSVDRSKVQILTKFGLVWTPDNTGVHFFDTVSEGKPISVYRNSSQSNIIKEVEASLTRLKTDFIDLLQIHWPDAETPISETINTMATLLKQGKIRAIGVSNYDLNQLKEALTVAHIDSIQLPYSMLNTSIEKEIVPFAIDNDISIIAYSPLERGLLTGKYRIGDSHLKGADHRKEYFKNFDQDRLNDLLNRLNTLATEKQCSIAQIVLAWTMAQPGITTVLAGARNREQAIDNAKALNISLTDEEMQLIKEAI